MSEKVLVEARALQMYFPIGSGFTGKPRKILKAVDEVDLSIKKGETFGLVGESGCGKTTVGRSLVRLYQPTGGTILYDGEDITNLDFKALAPYRKKLQMIFQDPYASLDPRMTVSSIIAEPLKNRTDMSKKDKDGRVAQLIELVGLKSDHALRYPHEFSGGQRQRIGIARALANNPEFIVCDEPISALDVSIQAQIINLLAQLQRELNLTVLFISHDLRVVRHITHRVMVMYLGSNVEVGPTGEIFRHPAHPYTQVLTKAAPKLDPLNRRREYAIEGEPPSPINTPSGCKFHPRCPYCTDKCRQEVPELREIAPGHLCACHYPL